MPTDWKHFRKVAENPDPEFLCLPAWVRGYASEMVRVARRPDGHLVTPCHGRHSRSQLIGVLLRAHPDEMEMIERAVAMLLEDGFLAEQDGALWIPNFQAAQESDDARRQRESRGKKKPSRSVTPVTESHTESQPVTDVTYKKRGEETRRDQIIKSAPKSHGKRDPMASMDATPADNDEVAWAFDLWQRDAGFTGATMTHRRKASLLERLTETRSRGDDWRQVFPAVLKAALADDWVSGKMNRDLSAFAGSAEQFEKFRFAQAKPKAERLEGVSMGRPG